MRNFVGIIIVLIGVGLLLQATGVTQADTVAKYFWPFIIIAVGVMAYRGNPRHWFGPLIIVLVGAMLLIDATNAFSRSAWNFFWPVVVVLIGIRIAFGRFPGPKNLEQSHNNHHPSAMFSGVEEKTSGPYAGGSASAWFGGMKLDLRQADIQDGAVLNVTAGFGGIEIFVPTTVKVQTSIAPMFGGSNNKTNPASSGKTLHINGTALFGGVDIKN